MEEVVTSASVTCVGVFVWLGGERFVTPVVGVVVGRLLVGVVVVVGCDGGGR